MNACHESDGVVEYVSEMKNTVDVYDVWDFVSGAFHVGYWTYRDDVHHFANEICFFLSCGGQVILMLMATFVAFCGLLETENVTLICLEMESVGGGGNDRDEEQERGF